MKLAITASMSSGGIMRNFCFNEEMLGGGDQVREGYIPCVGGTGDVIRYLGGT